MASLCVTLPLESTLCVVPTQLTTLRQLIHTMGCIVCSAVVAAVFVESLGAKHYEH